MVYAYIADRAHQLAKVKSMKWDLMLSNILSMHLDVVNQIVLNQMLRTFRTSTPRKVRPWKLRLRNLSFVFSEVTSLEDNKIWLKKQTSHHVRRKNMRPPTQTLNEHRGYEDSFSRCIFFSTNDMVNGFEIHCSFLCLFFSFSFFLIQVFPTRHKGARF